MFFVSSVLAQTCSKALRIVALGDSLTAGLGLAANEAYPELLQQSLRAKGWSLVIENAGVSGDTMAGGAQRVGWAVGEGADGVLVALGANDMLRGLPLDATRDALRSLLEELRSRKISVFLVGMKASTNLGEVYQRGFDAMYEEAAQRYASAYYPFLLDGVALNPALNQRDGLHPNAAGARVLAERLMPSFEAWIKTMRQGCS